MSTPCNILGPDGRPLERSDRVATLVDAMQKLARSQNARYDGATNSDEYGNYWANADAFDADSANSRPVRETLVRRARYEAANNGYVDGIVRTYATDLVGVGPMLRMQTGSENFNKLIERNWFLWTQATGFRPKLWTMAHAKCVDGESFGVIRRNPRVKHAIQLDVVLHETEQCQTPYLPFNEPGQIDGIRFDKFGNPESYEFLKQHPGSNNGILNKFESEHVPAELVLHWFKLRRPGQHRGVPEFASTLNLGAAFRRLREASLSTAEKIAAWTLFLKTQFQPDEMDQVLPLSTLEIVRGMMTALPNSVEPMQLKSEQPGPNYETFHRSLLNEQARPLSMPFNKAACDSASYNYASGRLDHQTYHQALDVDREDGNDDVLDPLFSVWFNFAIRKFGWLGGDPEAVGAGARLHTWDWPKHRVADVQAEASANETKLKSGQIFPHRLFADAGLDFEDELEKAAESFGVSIDEMRQRMLDSLFPPPKTAQSQAAPVVADAVLKRLNGSPILNGNGAHHGN